MSLEDKVDKFFKVLCLVLILVGFPAVFWYRDFKEKRQLEKEDKFWHSVVSELPSWLEKPNRYHPDKKNKDFFGDGKDRNSMFMTYCEDRMGRDAGPTFDSHNRLIDCQ